MSDEGYGATVAKRRLSYRLAVLRRRSGHPANHVCDMLNWGRGKVGRFEANQWRRPEMSDVRDLLRLYGVGGAEADEIEELAMQARVRPWWRDYPEIFDNEFPGFENDAVSISAFMPLTLPGLLQTTAYIEALMRTAARPPVWQRRALESRQRRQEILDRPHSTAPRLVAVITEAALRYRWGTIEDRREQIEHLAEVSRRPDVELRIQRFEDGPPQGTFSSINIFGLPAGDPTLVYLETDYSIEEVSRTAEVNTYIRAFGRVRDAALEPSDTTFYLRQLAEQLE
jgi:Domain of unknown function (DUF5753)/Helix-turn-helix domain